MGKQVTASKRVAGSRRPALLALRDALVVVGGLGGLYGVACWLQQVPPAVSILAALFVDGLVVFCLSAIFRVTRRSRRARIAAKDTPLARKMAGRR